MPRGLTILALVTDAFGGHGGVAQYNRDLLRALAGSANVERIVALPRNGSDTGEEKPRKVLQARPRPGRLSYSVNAFATALGQGPFDVIFCGHLYHAPLAAILARATGARLWLQAHGIEAWERPSRLRQVMAERSDLITAVSRHTRRRLLTWARMSPDRVHVLPNTIRPAFSPGPRDEATLERFGLTGVKIVLTVSRVDRRETYKGHDRVIKAMGEVRRVEPRACYAVVGDGDGLRDLRQLVEVLGLDDAVRFLGRLSDDDVISLYRSADAFIMPSDGEGFGIVFLEAAASGLPVIAGNRDGSTDALADGVIGRLIDPLSQEEIANALIETLRRRPAPALEAVHRFSHARFAEHVDSLVQSLAA